MCHPPDEVDDSFLVSLVRYVVADTSVIPPWLPLFCLVSLVLLCGHRCRLIAGEELKAPISEAPISEAPISGAPISETQPQLDEILGRLEVLEMLLREHSGGSGEMCAFLVTRTGGKLHRTAQCSRLAERAPQLWVLGMPDDIRDWLAQHQKQVFCSTCGFEKPGP